MNMQTIIFKTFPSLANGHWQLGWMVNLDHFYNIGNTHTQSNKSRKLSYPLPFIGHPGMAYTQENYPGIAIGKQIPHNLKMKIVAWLV
jgi:hypothetical protein